ncbi:Spore cortex-lytic enzyme [Orchesella cincta]|uniref:Spore cortex-lytic enzyme n=1 Tax=Orchesella cincta TaxID=48709 RepID=A0A1D2MYH9_ORCCI|nr:Spore cortex-lytic enzyme [Orchesella cincta]
MSAYDHEVLSKTIYEEARGEPEVGQEWVGHVIMNRARQRGISIAEVCLQPYQFECWNGRAPGDLQIRESGAYEVSKRVARMVMNRTHDPTGGCDHYNNPTNENADWVNRVTFVRQIGGHHFYRA